MRRTWGVVALGAAMAVGLAGGGALAASAGTTTATVYACVDTVSNKIVTPTAKGSCPGTAKRKVINQRGPRGYTGATGQSAYEVAVAAGFDGTAEEWLDSLQGGSGGTPTVIDGGTP
ncbi:hypothetical protein [Demequina silvatica]|uniref:hypothetical protein n=1 Tax=Demequina silvatica TaxID=1638988 RepID=UPI000783A028|nr:hypothetical protein [Demequina silvatica]